MGVYPSALGAFDWPGICRAAGMVLMAGVYPKTIEATSFRLALSRRFARNYRLVDGEQRVR